MGKIKVPKSLKKWKTILAVSLICAMLLGVSYARWEDALQLKTDINTGVAKATVQLINVTNIGLKKTAEYGDRGESEPIYNGTATLTFETKNTGSVPLTIRLADNGTYLKLAAPLKTEVGFNPKDIGTVLAESYIELRDNNYKSKIYNKNVDGGAWRPEEIFQYVAMWKSKFITVKGQDVDYFTLQPEETKTITIPDFPMVTTWTTRYDSNALDFTRLRIVAYVSLQYRNTLNSDPGGNSFSARWNAMTGQWNGSANADEEYYGQLDIGKYGVNGCAACSMSCKGYYEGSNTCELNGTCTNHCSGAANCPCAKNHEKPHKEKSIATMPLLGVTAEPGVITEPEVAAEPKVTTEPDIAAEPEQTTTTVESDLVVTTSEGGQQE